MGTIVGLEELADLGEVHRNRGDCVISTNGAFDILHVGHVRSLKSAKDLGGRNGVLFVGVNSDASVRGYKSDKRPVIGENDRAEMLAALGCVDYVTIFNELDPRVFLARLRPHIHTKSGDYDAEKMIETPVVRANGGKVIILPFYDGLSTSKIIDKIKDVYG